MMKKLSTGENSTLGNYRKLAVIFFGEDSAAIKFLDYKISAQGDGEEVIADERQVIALLMEIDKQGVFHPGS